MKKRMASAGWAAAVVVALLVPCGFAGSTAARELLAFGDGVDIIGQHKQILDLRNGQRVLSPLKKLQPSRAMLQFQAIEFCGFEDGECFPLTLQNVPDGDTLELFLKNANCGIQSNETTCHGTIDCLWVEEECVLDFTAAIRNCYDIDFITTERAAECTFLTVESKCEIIPGCIWEDNAGSCSSNQEEVVAALNNNTQLGEAFLQNRKCRESIDCGGDCALLGDVCLFPGFFNFSDFSVSSSPMCQFLDKRSDCALSNPASCPEECQLDEEEGDCFLSTLSEEFVDITYAQNPTLQDQMKEAVQQCPSITSASDCGKFAP